MLRDAHSDSRAVPAREAPRDASRDDSPLASGRAALAHRDHAYRLTPAETRSLSDLATFRVVAASDLGLASPTGTPLEVRHLVRRGLVLGRLFEAGQGATRELLTLTREGHGLVRENRLVPFEQSTYWGFAKPREANHDADIYRMYQQEALLLEAKGSRPVRVVLDYELRRRVNQELYRWGAEASAEIAARHGLRVVRGKIPIPDLQIECHTTQGEFERVNLELVTEHYQGRSVCEKAQAGFQLYAPQADLGRWNEVLRQYDLSAEVRWL